MAKPNHEPAADFAVRLPADLYELARELSEWSQGHVLGRRSITEIVAAAVAAGLPIVDKALRKK